jgi:hypothetical protein
MTDPIGKRSDDVEQVSGRAHQPVEAGDNQHVAVKNLNVALVPHSSSRLL